MLKFLYRVGFQVARQYWRVTRPITLGVLAIVINDSGEVLLVRHSYRRGWFLPGGGVGRGESIGEAIERELREEVGVLCESRPELIGGPFYSMMDYKHDHRFVFLCRSWSEMQDFCPDAEIEEARFFARDDLPEDISAGMRLRLEEYYSSETLSAITENFDWLNEKPELS